MEKTHTVRVYALRPCDLEIVRCAILSDMVNVERSFLGTRGLLMMADVRCSVEGLMELIGLGVRFLPLDHYGDFEITCPVCGERIDDDMILRNYDEHVLGGENILCGRRACGYQLANVRWVGDSASMPD